MYCTASYLVYSQISNRFRERKHEAEVSAGNDINYSMLEAVHMHGSNATIENNKKEKTINL